MFLSVFDVFKIGVGPSSSHTMGPMSAANRFLRLIAERQENSAAMLVAAIRVSLHGSLAFTGTGHGSDRAIVLGLMGENPSTVDPDRVDAILAMVRESRAVTPPGHSAYRFDIEADLTFDRSRVLDGHANGMRFLALDEAGALLFEQVYYSVGGGFVVTDTEFGEMRSAPPGAPAVPYPFATADEMLAMADASGLSIAQMKRANELTFTPSDILDEGLDRIVTAMLGCIDRGLRGDGLLPGRLKVRRRAKAIHTMLTESARRNCVDPMMANDWLSVYAMAVNEENAVGGRVVTAPTNGAAGVVPATLKYFLQFHAAGDVDWSRARDFLLTSAAIGGIVKHNASISGAEVGCQGEVGSAAAMAAAALAAALGGSPRQAENAAEIALEHHLGMTCDPIGGLVQIPCIERNALGAVKAVTAASLALKGDGLHHVSLDNCVMTMWQTGQDMSEKYKETSTGGLALNVVEC